MSVRRDVKRERRAIFARVLREECERLGMDAAKWGRHRRGPVAPIHLKVNEGGAREFRENLHYAHGLHALGMRWQDARRKSEDIVRTERHHRDRWLRLVV